MFCPVAVDAHVHHIGQCHRELIHDLLNGVCNRKRRLVASAEDLNLYRWQAIETGVKSAFLETVVHGGNVTERYRSARVGGQQYNAFKGIGPLFTFLQAQQYVAVIGGH